MMAKINSMLDTVETTMGDILRQAREAKNLSLEDVSKATKISVKVLRALEAQDFTKLPSEIYTRAFVKSYTGFLGIGSEALEQYEKVARPAISNIPLTRPETPLTTLSDQRVQASVRRMRAMAGTLIVGIVVVAAGIFFYRAFSAHKVSQSAVSRVASTPAPKTSISVLPKIPLEQTASVKLQQEAHVMAPLPSPSAVPHDGLYLEIVAVDKVWLRVKADNLLLFEGTLAKDDRETWKAQHEFLLRVGSAGAVALYLNGVELGRVGNKGEVKTIVINKDGVVKTR